MEKGERIYEGVEAILFDFEGTLVDFQWQLAAAVEDVLKALEGMGLGREGIVSRKYSTLLPEAVKKAAPMGLRADAVKEAIFAIYDRYDEDALTRWSLRPGVKDFLTTVRGRGVRTGLVSNVGAGALGKALAKLGLEGFFDVALSRNDVANLKPAPDGMNLALEKLGVAKERAIFVGDSLDDVNGARNAGLRVLIISDGENLREEIAAAGPDYVVQGYGELTG